MTTRSPSGRSFFVTGEATACAVDFLAWTGLALVAVATDGPPEGPSCLGFPACGRPELSRARQAQAENGAPWVIISAEPLRQYGIVWTICQSTRQPHHPPA